MIEFKCSQCDKLLKVKEDAAGKKGKCPQCGATLLVPQPELLTLEAADTSQSTPPPLPRANARSADEGPQPPPLAKPRIQKHRRWVVLLIVGALVASPFAPKFPLWFGIILLVLCVVAFIPSVQGFSRRLLRLKPREKSRNGLRLAMYGLIGLALIIAGRTGAEYKAEQGRIAAKQAEEEAEQRRLANEANGQVIALVREAELAWQSGKPALADEKLASAGKIPHATDLASIRQLHARMANAEVASLMVEATSAVKAGDIKTAKEKVQAALVVPHADALAKAKELDEKIRDATDPNRIRAHLMALPEEPFQQLQESGSMPVQLVSGYRGLDSLTADLARAQLADVAAARTQRRQEQLERQRAAAEAARKAEEERKAGELAGAEAARKAQEERRAQEQAKKEAAQKEVKDRLDAYVALLNAAEVRLVDNVSVRRSDDSTWEATLTVENLWHVRHYQVRLQDAQTLWEAWAKIASPRKPDSARIRIVDQRGNEVGGSRVWGGSLIWVKED